MQRRTRHHSDILKHFSVLEGWAAAGGTSFMLWLSVNVERHMEARCLLALGTESAANALIAETDSERL
ncbi:hypothetical protein AM571_PC00263 (plasmid) [Rhizobium etli 8C-3]|uniref:Uncharacterized protein n=1 Tax=Rhizobium etli 8C-3 TaxID=538025 RepID=A0A1L5PD13_RHIET|nr:hypothetical protein AM571_PC00263 [Rhizobium etli 8C-3]